MAYALTVDKLEDDGTIKVRHIFYGETEDDVYHERDQHADGCKAFGPALKDDRVIETIEEVDEMPEWEDSDEDDEEDED